MVFMEPDQQVSIVFSFPYRDLCFCYLWLCWFIIADLCNRIDIEICRSLLKEFSEKISANLRKFIVICILSATKIKGILTGLWRCFRM